MGASLHCRQRTTRTVGRIEDRANLLRRQMTDELLIVAFDRDRMDPADLLLLVRKKHETARYMQAEAAKVLKISRPRVSDLQRGKITLFTLDTLMELLERLGEEIHIEVRKPKREAAKAAGLLHAG